MAIRTTSISVQSVSSTAASLADASAASSSTTANHASENPTFPESTEATVLGRFLNDMRAGNVIRSAFLEYRSMGPKRRSLAAPPSPSPNFSPFLLPNTFLEQRLGNVHAKLTRLNPSIAALSEDPTRFRTFLEEIILAETKAQGETQESNSKLLFRCNSNVTGLNLYIKRLKAAHGSHEFKQMSRSQHFLAISHPHLVPIYAILEAPDVLYIIMEWIDGKDLFETLTTFQDFSSFKDKKEGMPTLESLCAKWLRQILLGLSALHKTDRLHRDIKPENVMVQFSDGHYKEARVCLCDFDFIKQIPPTSDEDHSLMSRMIHLAEISLQAPARSNSPCITDRERQALRQLQVHSPCGTPDFLAPEYFFGLPDKRSYSFRSDLFAIGILAREILGGSPLKLKVFTLPYFIKTFRNVLLEHWSERAKDFVAKALCLLPDKRFGSVEEMLSDPFLQVDETTWEADFNFLRSMIDDVSRQS